MGYSSVGICCEPSIHTRLVFNVCVFANLPLSKNKPDPDRARCWMEFHQSSLSFSELVQLFDWNVVKAEQQAIIYLTKLLTPLVSSAQWWDASSKPQKFQMHVSHLLGAMRQAVLLQSALVKGNLSMDDRRKWVFVLRSANA